MKPELKAKWIANLRSGKYRQCHGGWGDDTRGYCCIGVLLHMVQGSMDGHRKTAEELGLDDKRDSTVQQLIDMNDKHRLGFPQIADWIEANVPSDASATEESEK